MYFHRYSFDCSECLQLNFLQHVIKYSILIGKLVMMFVKSSILPLLILAHASFLSKFRKQNQFFKIDLKKTPLIQNTILDSLSEFFNMCNMYFGPLHFANHLHKYFYNICNCKLCYISVMTL